MKRDERRDNGARPDFQITGCQRTNRTPWNHGTRAAPAQAQRQRTPREDRLALEVLARVAHCREALEAGDVGLAVDMLVDLEHDLVYLESVSRPTGDESRRHRCNVCRTTFRWPGELGRHEDVTGHGLEEMA